MHQAEEFRRRAQDCIDLANAEVDLVKRTTLLDLASEWLKLADQADRDELLRYVPSAAHLAASTNTAQ